MATVALDADVLIAFLDSGDAQHERAVKELRAKMADGARLVLGSSVYAEVMVRPLAQGTDARVEEFLEAAQVTVTSVDRTLARRAAELRARHRSLRPGDALSLATALANDAELLTFDERLRRVAKREQEPTVGREWLARARRGPTRRAPEAEQQEERTLG